MNDSAKLDLILSKIDILDTKVDALDKRVGSLETKVDALDKRVGSLETNVIVLNDRVAKLETEVKILNNDTKDIKLTLENEIRVNIQWVAEGHLDLSRNLHEAMKPSNELGMLSVRMLGVESEVRELKLKIS